MKLNNILTSPLFKKTMKNTVIGLLFLSVLWLTYSSCSTATTCSVSKSGFLTNFDTMIKKVSEKELKSNDDQWASYDQKFEKFVEECYPSYEENMTEEEKQKFWLKSVEYYWHRYGLGFIKRLGDENDPLSQEIVRNAEETWGGVDEIVSHMLDEFGMSIKDFDTEQFEDLFNDIGNDIGKWGKKLEKIFKDVERKNRNN